MANYACLVSLQPNFLFVNPCSSSFILPTFLIICLSPFLLLQLKPNKRHQFASVDQDRRFSHVRITIYPDGGISRLRVYGRPDIGHSAITLGSMDFSDNAKL